MTVLVTGADGQLGYDICKELAARGIKYVGATKQDFDLINAQQVGDYIKRIKPQAVVHCAAYTQVDKAENEIELCEQVNWLGTARIAEICAQLGARLMYISTDYVFDGTKIGEYTLDDRTNPLNVYGRTKLAGEQAVRNTLEEHFIVRTSWVFGINGGNFIKTMLRLAEQRGEVSVVCDQIGSPTYTVDLARLICDMLSTEKYGTYHATNRGFCSWSEFAVEVFKQSGSGCVVHPIPTNKYLASAKRPLNSCLDKTKLENVGFAPLPQWQDALKRFLAELKIN